MEASRSITEQDLAQFPILAALDKLQSERAVARARIVRLDRGDHLFHQGDPAHRIWLCRTGQLKLFRLSHSGQEKIIALINPGRSFAEATLFMPQRRYPVHCAALTSSELVGFDADDLVETLRTDTEACFRLLGTMSRRMHEKIGQIDALALQNAHLRVAGYLLAEFRRHDQADVFRLCASKKHIAGLLAIQPETLSRSLAQLQKDGILEVHARSIMVTQPERLERIVLGGGLPAH
jgi:CRP/FNR family transcriptional regulator, dissimilatory nitrate respiration regulator